MTPFTWRSLRIECTGPEWWLLSCDCHWVSDASVRGWQMLYTWVPLFPSNFKLWWNCMYHGIRNWRFFLFSSGVWVSLQEKEGKKNSEKALKSYRNLLFCLCWLTKAKTFVRLCCFPDWVKKLPLSMKKCTTIDSQRRSELQSQSCWGFRQDEGSLHLTGWS